MRFALLLLVLLTLALAAAPAAEAGFRTSHPAYSR
jgi:hypothetical protein